MKLFIVVNKIYSIKVFYCRFEWLKDKKNMILPKQTILKRVIDGMDDGCRRKIKDKLQINSDISNTGRFAEEILNLEKSKRIKFNEIYNQYFNNQRIDELSDQYKKTKNNNPAQMLL